MDIIEKTISNLIEHQFPAVYRDEGPVFIAFVKEYYKWLEKEGNAIHLARHLMEYRDVDETIDQFLVYFKETYLKNIKFDTNTDIRQIIKHSLDLYKSKGTERGIDLLFRLVYGTGASIYYPARDLFKLSDGKWERLRYIELSLNENTTSFVNKQIRGVTSKATAFVERVVRKNINNKLLDVAYISNIEGEFLTGEYVTAGSGSITSLPFVTAGSGSITSLPFVLGSLNDIVIDKNGVGTGFKIGDILTVVSDNGEQGLVRVANTTNIAGIIDFEILNGGYGYTANSNVYISSVNIFLDDVIVSPGSNTFFNVFENISQPLANINFINSTGSFANGDLIYTYHPNNAIKGSGEIISVAAANSSAGEMFVFVNSGNLVSNAIYKSGNTISANLTVSNNYIDKTATANVIGVSNTVSLKISSYTTDFIVNEEICQYGDSNTIIAKGIFKTIKNISGPFAEIQLGDSHGIWDIGSSIVGKSSNSTANITNITLTVGLVNDLNNFVIGTGFVRGLISNTTSSVSQIFKHSTGQSATFNISNTLAYSETISIITDLISTYANVALNATTFGFPGNTSANISYVTIAGALTNNIITIGKIDALSGINPGTQYTFKPMVLVNEPRIAMFNKKDMVLNLTGPFNFAPGEIITQDATDARGLIKATSNQTILFVENLRFDDSKKFVITSNTTTQIVGEKSLVTANISLAQNDTLSTNLGRNAIINDSLISGNGAITTLNVLDSGYGYSNSESILLYNSNGNFVEAVANVNGTGTSNGKYLTTGGFLSANKKLFDGYYWQEYSYEIRSSIDIDKYSDMIRNVMHIAGTKFFGLLDHKSIANSSVDIQKAIITVS